MTRLINADELKNTIVNICGKCSNNITEYDENHIPNGNCAIWHILNIIDNAPTEEYPFYQEAYQTGYDEGKNERQPGEWTNTSPYDDKGECSLCCYLSKKYYKFCPNCGADMRGDKE